MKIKEITDEYILFDNDYKLTDYHYSDCCECNYADYTQLEDTGIEDEEFEYNEKAFEFEDDNGFRLVANSGNKYFIPCYSIQNGYYSCAINIVLKDNKGKTIFDKYCHCRWVDN